VAIFVRNNLQADIDCCDNTVTVTTNLRATAVMTTTQFPWQLVHSKHECQESSWSNGNCESVATRWLHYSQFSRRPPTLSFATATELLDNAPSDDEDDSLALFVTSLIDDNVFWNQVFFDDWASITVAFSWWMRSWFLHSDSTRASFVCASSSSSSRISWSLSVDSGLSALSPSTTVSSAM